MGGVRNARMIKAQVCCSMGCKWYTYAIHHDNPCYNIYLNAGDNKFKGGPRTLSHCRGT